MTPQLRRRARERAMQFLFSLDFTGEASPEIPEAFWTAHPARDSAKPYAQAIVSGVMAHRDELDVRLNAALKNWSATRVGRVERNILRIALYEMTYRDDVPAKVAMNEAIEIAKEFASEDSPGFINGVLDRLNDERLESISRDARGE